MNVTSEKSTLSNPTPALPAPSTKKSKTIKKKRKLSKTQKELDFIIRKHVKPDKIVWPRDLAVLRGLRKDFPEYVFWQALPAHFQMNSMQGFLTEKSQAFLKLEYAKFNLQIPEAAPIILSPEPLCEPLVVVRKPKSILEFCR